MRIPILASLLFLASATALPLLENRDQKSPPSWERSEETDLPRSQDTVDNKASPPSWKRMVTDPSPPSWRRSSPQAAPSPPSWNREELETVSSPLSPCKREGHKTGLSPCIERDSLEISISPKSSSPPSWRRGSQGVSPPSWRRAT